MEMNRYPGDWKSIATKVKDEADWRCIRCKRKHAPAAGYCLTVHHLDGKKYNCHWWNLIALCQRCHLQVQAKVRMNQTWAFEHKKWFKPYVAGYHASIRGLPTDRRYVMANLESLQRP